MTRCVCCGRFGAKGHIKVDRGLIHFDCYVEHHCGPDTPWPPDHECAAEPASESAAREAEA
ncbi:hypothetical protein [uncultured Nocardioides sp.]|uniref:hypothetical protein n=1 Tax=uncultured Nocardioides sp. TaxID=198441 RepID=UPI0026087DAA|nr:hypothetical protein [uncultured Nocardioides sp.]